MSNSLGLFNGNAELSGRLSPAEVHRMLFARAGLGRRGYDEAEVDAFLDRVQAELSRLIAEKGELRDEVNRWKDEVEELRSSQEGKSAEPSTGLRRDAASAQAVRVLSAAQQMADQYVSDAEHYSKRMSSETRQHCEDLISQARAKARAIVEEAERSARAITPAGVSSVNGTATESQPAPAADAGPSKQELEEQIAYLRTFGQVTRVQLRAYLEALLRDVEEEWGRAHPQAARELPSAPRPLNGRVISAEAEGAATDAESAPSDDASDDGSGDGSNAGGRAPADGAARAEGSTDVQAEASRSH